MVMVLPNTGITDELIAREYTELFTVGYPRSGNTWTGRLLSDILSSPWQEFPGAPVRFYGPDNIGRFVIRKRHTKERLPGPTIFIFRDPRDVCVSASFYYGHPSIEHTIQFMLGHTDQDIDFYGNYEEFVREWWDNPNKFTTFVIYERLHLEPVVALLRRIVHQITGLNFPIGHIEAAYDRQRFAVIRRRFPDYAHSMRKGIVGDWRNHFTRDNGRLFQEYFGNLMLEQGYIDDGDWWEGLPL